MSKYSIIILSVLCLLQTGCSLAPSAANRAYNAYDSREYKESLRLATRALSLYEYSIEDQASLVVLKANNYLKLGKFSDAEGVFRYLIDAYPNTEATFRAKALLSSKIKKIGKLKKNLT